MKKREGTYNGFRVEAIVNDEKAFERAGDEAPVFVHYFTEDGDWQQWVVRKGEVEWD